MPECFKCKKTKTTLGKDFSTGKTLKPITVKLSETKASFTQTTEIAKTTSVANGFLGCPMYHSHRVIFTYFPKESGF